MKIAKPSTASGWTGVKTPKLDGACRNVGSWCTVSMNSSSTLETVAGYGRHEMLRSLTTRALTSTGGCQPQAHPVMITVLGRSNDDDIAAPLGYNLYIWLVGRSRPRARRLAGTASPSQFHYGIGIHTQAFTLGAPVNITASSPRALLSNATFCCSSVWIFLSR